jgi:hypothetical protein
MNNRHGSKNITANALGFEGVVIFSQYLQVSSFLPDSAV